MLDSFLTALCSHAVNLWPKRRYVASVWTSSYIAFQTSLDGERLPFEALPNSTDTDTAELQAMYNDCR